MSETKRKLLRALILSLRTDPASWRWGEKADPGYIAHASGLKVWTYYGSAYLWKPDKVTFGFLGWMRLRSAFRQWRRVQGRADMGAVEAAGAAEALEIITRFYARGQS